MRRVARRLAARAGLSRLWGFRKQHRKQTRADETDIEESPDMTCRYNIAKTAREADNILEWVCSNHDDVATKVCPGTPSTGVRVDTDFRTSSRSSKIIY